MFEDTYITAAQTGKQRVSVAVWPVRVLGEAHGEGGLLDSFCGTPGGHWPALNVAARGPWGQPPPRRSRGGV